MADNNNSSNTKLKPVRMFGASFNIADLEKFSRAIKLLQESLFDGGKTMICSDNIITWNKNFSFLREERFLNRLKDPERDDIEKSIIWRTYILLYFAKLALELDGDFLECGAYKGTTAKDVLEECDLEKYGKKYWLYDLFGSEELDEDKKLSGHENSNMYEDVVSRFSNHKEVHIIKGRVPESFSQGFPDKVAFCHIDMNHPLPEVGALERVLPRLVKGGCIIFDDYGWWSYSEQKIALDLVVKSFEQEILELPTGQGLLIKQ